MFKIALADFISYSYYCVSSITAQFLSLNYRQKFCTLSGVGVGLEKRTVCT